MYYLLRKKSVCRICVALALLLASVQGFAQLRELNLPDHDDKKVYLGISVMYVSSRFQISQHPVFLQQDSIMAVNPENSGGFGVGGLLVRRLSPRLELRTGTEMMFITKNLTYSLNHPDPAKGEQRIETKKVESILFSVPLHLKFNSDRIGNFRVYMFGGGKFDYDLSSNSTARRAEDLVKLKKIDLGAEFGIGFHFYFPYFIFSPELKFSNGLMNIHSRDPNLKYSNVIDKMNSRMVVLSFIIEG